MKKDYYATLGILRQASSDEIKAAFKKIAREHHPDVAKDDMTSADIFKEANEAYETLGDLSKRQAYDIALSNALVTDINEEVRIVVDEYFRELHI